MDLTVNQHTLIPTASFIEVSDFEGYVDYFGYYNSNDAARIIVRASHAEST